jgi:hypothetical protein
MTEQTFDSNCYIRVDTNPAQWMSITINQTLATRQPYTVFDTLEEAVEAGYEPESSIEEEQV